jgi:vancomycin resistance protein YoaR
MAEQDVDTPDEAAVDEVAPERHTSDEGDPGPREDPEAQGADAEAEADAADVPKARPEVDETAPEAGPTDEPEAAAGVGPEPVAAVEPEAESGGADTEPVASADEPEPGDDVVPEPEPDPDPDPAPEPEPEPDPDPNPDPEPAPDPDPDPAPAPVAAPGPVVEASPASAWTPQPWTAPGASAGGGDDGGPATEVLAPVSPAPPVPGRPALDAADVTPPPALDAPDAASAAAAEAPAPLTAPPAAPAVPAAAAAAADPAPPGSPMDVFPDHQHPRRWPRVLGIGAAGALVLGGAYVAALWLTSDRVPAGTVVAGVEIGSLRADDAVATLTDALAGASTEPIPVAAGGRRTALDPVAAGLSLDAAATVDQVTGFGLEPGRLWRQVFGGGAVDPVTTVDDDALAGTVGEVADALRTDPVNGTVVFVDGQATTTDPVDGVAVDEQGAAELLADAWLTAPRPVELPTEVTGPDIDAAALDAAVGDLARPLVAAPIVVEVAGQRAELPAEVLAGAATFVPDGDALELQLDGELLAEAVTVRTTNLLNAPADATFAFTDGVPVVVPGTPGTTLDPDALASAVAAAAMSSDRVARTELVASDPAASTAELESLGITEVVSEFSTPLTSEPRRTLNITNGASKISGTLVRPGDTFSLTDALGPIDAAHGYVEAGAIVSGEHTDAWGGGLSQISTTTFNAAYFAGMEIVEHTPHSEWFARYPEGREATIFTGVIDMKWRNDTPYGALVQAWVQDGRVYVRIWGTKYWTVESTTSGRSGVVAPTTVYSQSPTCEAQNAGNPGFTVTVTRRVLLGSTEASTDSWTTRYRPQNEIVCGPEPTAPPAP